MSGAGNFVFVVLLPTAHRVNVKATSNTSILQILEDACTKSGLNALEWDLKHYNRILELSNSVRFSGLPNNATLEMIQSTKPRRESTVKLGLQLESGKRLMEQFRPSQTLWEILEHWKSKGENMLLMDSEREDGILPVCVYMRHEVVGQINLQTMTLRSLGLTHGSAIIRLLYRSENQLKHQANVSAPLSRTSTKLSEEDKNFKGETSATISVMETETCEANKQVDNKEELTKSVYEVENTDPKTTDNGRLAKIPKVNNISGDNATMWPISSVEKPNKTNNIQTSSNSSNEVKSTCEGSMEVDEAEIAAPIFSVPSIVNARRYSKAGDYFIIGKKDAILYHSDDIVVQRNENIPDDFYDVTLADVDSIYKALKSKREALEESPLQTAAQRTLEKEQATLRNIRDHPTTTVRIRFSNRYVLQGTFRTVETIGAVADFVRQFLVDPDLDFYLFTAPPKKLLSNEIRLVEQNLVGLAVVYFGSQVADEPILKPELYGKLSDPIIVFENLRVSQKSSLTGGNASDTFDTVNQVASSSGAHAHNSSSLNVPRTDLPRQGANRNRNNISSGKVPKWFK